MADVLSAEELREAKVYHFPIPSPEPGRKMCNHDDQWWPCEVFKALATIEAQARELATLAVQAERYREALEIAREALNWRDNEIRLGIRDLLGEEEIRAVGERFGYGVLMSTASRLWYEKAGSGAFAVGHCIAIVEKADRVVAAVLEGGEK